VLGKREIGSILKWRGKVRHHFNQLEAKQEKEEAVGEQGEMEEENNSEADLEREVLNSRRREIKQLKEKEDRRSELMVKSQLADQQHHSDEDQFGEDVEDVFDSAMEEL
jgi:hypothetical protein